MRLAGARAGRPRAAGGRVDAGAGRAPHPGAIARAGVGDRLPDADARADAGANPDTAAPVVPLGGCCANAARRHLGLRAACALVFLAACGGDREKRATEPAIEIPARAATAGDDLLKYAPAGADAVLEVDFERLRANPVVGKLFAALTADPAVASEGHLDLASAADLLVVASYEIGDAEPERLVLLRGPHTDRIAGAIAVADNVVALASKEMEARLGAVRAGTEPGLSADRPLLKIRALAMPEGAKTASLRMAARLDFDARIAVARALELDEVPIAVSVWGDVIDDLALIALVNGVGKNEGVKLAKALTRVRDRLAAAPQMRWTGLAPVIRGAEIDGGGVAARAVLLIGPQRLARMASVLERALDRARTKGARP